MVSFKLSNPKIIGEFNDTVSAKNKLEAANKMWINMTKYVTHNVPTFRFTLKNTQTGGYCHFQVDESVKGKLADYNIKEFKVKLTAKQKKNFENEIEKLEKINVIKKRQFGGYKRKEKRKRDDDDSSSSSDDDDDEIYGKYKLLKYTYDPQPIVYWWYTPTIYKKISNIYVPTFTVPLYPYVNIDFSSAFFGS